MAQTHIFDKKVGVTVPKFVLTGQQQFIVFCLISLSFKTPYQSNYSTTQHKLRQSDFEDQRNVFTLSSVFNLMTSDTFANTVTFLVGR